MTQFFVEQLSAEEIQMVCSAINTYGDNDHPVATSEGLKYFGLPYVAHCLGRQHQGVIGTGLMKSPEYQNEQHVLLHNAHDALLDKINSAIEFGVSSMSGEEKQKPSPT